MDKLHGNTLKVINVCSVCGVKPSTVEFYQHNEQAKKIIEKFKHNNIGMMNRGSLWV
jgi:hypothetical protein